MMNRNKNLDFLYKSYTDGLRGAVLEGASRSGKTFSGIDFVIWLCAANDGITINIIRETYNSFKTTLYDDFNRRLPQAGIPSPFVQTKNVSSFWIFDCKVNLMGADNPAKFHGAGSDYFWINEALDVPQSIFDQLEQRCRRFWWMDYNPKVTDHWVYNKVCSRPDVKLFHSSFRDNPHISKAELSKILSYEPTAANIKAGTADDYMWKVYGLGERAAPEGLIFQNVTWIDSFPENIEIINYGLDFGYTNSPTALCKVGRDGMNLYLEKIIYQPIDNSELLGQMMKATIGDCSTWADSADPGMISDLRNRHALRVLAVKKFPGSIEYGINLLKRFKLHIVRDADFQREQANYRWRMVNGIKLNEPIDDFNHLWDAARYAVISTARY
jgi:PBSX family phage terminase large subunit